MKRIVRADVPMSAYVVHVRACGLSCACGDGEHMRGTGLKRNPRSGARKWYPVSWMGSSWRGVPIRRRYLQGEAASAAPVSGAVRRFSDAVWGERVSGVEGE